MSVSTGEDLRTACDDVRDATPDDAIDGVQPRYVAAPASVEEVAELLRSSAGLRVAVRGGGSKLGWGSPPGAVDLLLDTRRLDAVLEYNPGDLVLAAQAGTPLTAVQDRVGAEGQLLGLDPPEPAATLGGVVAANAAGPRRLRYGTARDLLIGVTAVLADGTVARAGGKVVKNVAGYDLMKLYCGSLGTLGVIAETTWRLHPRPPARRVVTVSAYDGETVQRVLHSTLTPTAVEIVDDALVLLFEAIEPSVQAQATQAVELLGGTVGEDLPAGFGERPWRDGGAGVEPGDGPSGGPSGGPRTGLGIGLSIAYEVAALPQVLAAVRRLDGAVVRGRAASGVLEVGLASLEPAALSALRAAVAPVDGTVVVRAAPNELKADLDVWGPVGNSLPLMRRVKERFDPDRRLAPGRFVGGI